MHTRTRIQTLKLTHTPPHINIHDRTHILTHVPAYTHAYTHLKLDKNCFCLISSSTDLDDLHILLLIKTYHKCLYTVYVQP